MLDYIPFPLKMEWLFFLIYSFSPLILGSYTSKKIKAAKRIRIEKKLLALEEKNG